MNLKLLKETRIKNRYSQRQLAEAIGVSTVSYCNWENGKTKPLKVFVDKLEKLLEIYLQDK